MNRRKIEKSEKKLKPNAWEVQETGKRKRREVRKEGFQGSVEPAAEPRKKAN